MVSAGRTDGGINHARTAIGCDVLSGTDLAHGMAEVFPSDGSDSGERNCQKDLRDESGSVADPDLRARPGDLHPALPECGPPRYFVLEALPARARLRPGAVCAARQRTPRDHPRFRLPARLVASAAAHDPAQAPPVLVVAARQAGQRLACAAV